MKTFRNKENGHMHQVATIYYAMKNMFMKF